MRFAKNMCPSQGTMDIFVEPVLPRPEIVVCGSSPVAVALAELARRLGFQLTACAPAAEQACVRRRPTAASRAMRFPSNRRARASSWCRRRAAATRRRSRRRLPSTPTTSPSSAAGEKAAALRAKLLAEGVDAARLDEAQGAGRARSRRHHPGRDRALHSVGDRGASPEGRAFGSAAGVEGPGLACQPALALKTGFSVS